MKQFTLIIFVTLLFITNSVYSQEIYSKVQIFYQNIEQIQNLASEGLILDHPAYEKDILGHSLIVFIDSKELEILRRSDLNFRILSPDVKREYNQRKKMSLTELNSIQSESELEGFEFGSMGGYYTLEEVYAELDSMFLNYPNLITAKDSIGSTIESRPIYSVKISDNPTIDEEEPELLYTALHHAREPAGMMAVVYFMYYLLENYGTDPEVTYLVDNREFYFIPVVNPDGYKYNEETDPNGGGMWRKNRRDNGDGSFGVDLNRNYGYEWGYDDVGSSPDPSSNTYRGTSPFSEPEILTIRDFCREHNFILALNYHTYSNLLIHPFGYNNSQTPDSSSYLNYATEMTKFNHYGIGTSYSTLGYYVNGKADDWMYGEQTSKNKILAMTPEVGSSSDGFWPDQSRIYPLVEENLYPNLILPKFAGGYVSIVDYEITEIGDNNGFIDPGEEGEIQFTIINLGQSNNENTTISLTSNESLISIENGENLQIPTLQSQEMRILAPIRFSVASNMQNGSSFSLIANLFQYYVESKDTLAPIVIGTPKMLFADQIDNLTNWELTGSWDTITTSFHSEPYSFTDSPIGNYDDDVEAHLTLKSAIDVSNDSIIYLEYWTKWDIEAEWDFAQVYISSDLSNWEQLKGHYMDQGSGNSGGVQPIDQFGYDGLQKEWIKETINISEYSDYQNLYFRFTFKSDQYVTNDGWYIDDIAVNSYNQDEPQNIIAQIKIVLEGAYDIDGSIMSTSLNGNIPTTSPYTDGISITNIPTNAVDWVYVELRDKNDGETILAGQSGLLLNNKDVVNVYGNPLEFDLPADEYYIVIKHRNHLPIMSANPVQLSVP